MSSAGMPKVHPRKRSPKGPLETTKVQLPAADKADDDHYLISKGHAVGVALWATWGSFCFAPVLLSLFTEALQVLFFVVFFFPF